MLPTTVWIPGEADPHHGGDAGGDGIEHSPHEASNAAPRIATVSAPTCAAGDTITMTLTHPAAVGTRSAPRTAIDLWNTLLSLYLASRAHGASATGEAYPETTAGDVRRVAAGFSRQLCLPV